MVWAPCWDRWHTLALAFVHNVTIPHWPARTAVMVTLDGENLGIWAVAARSGMVGLATGWNEAQFDQVETRPLPDA